MTKNTKTVIILLVIAALIAIVPLFALKGAEFGGSDDAGSEMISEIQGKEYEPWFTPVLETALGGELPGEIESLILSSDRNRSRNRSICIRTLRRTKEVAGQGEWRFDFF